MQARKGILSAEERDLQQAIKLSEEEQRKRAEEMAKLKQDSVFDDSNNLYVSFTGWRLTRVLLGQPRININAPTNPFPLVDVGGSQYGVQPQFTQVHAYVVAPANQVDMLHLPQQVPQMTSFNPYQAQMQQEALQVCFRSSIHMIDVSSPQSRRSYFSNNCGNSYIHTNNPSSAFYLSYSIVRLIYMLH